MSLHTLYASLTERWTTERVARALLAQTDVALSGTAQSLLARSKGGKTWWTSMAETFDQAVAPRAQVAVGLELFPSVAGPGRIDDPAALSAYVDRLKETLGVSGTRFAFDRPAKADRVGSKRGFNKRFRFVKRLEDKVRTFDEVRTLKGLAQIAKTRLASQISHEAFVADPATACFLAWMTARLGRRSVFTSGKQARPFDRVAQALLTDLGPEANWFAVAHVYPAPEVLAHLSAYDRGRLVGVWFEVMTRAAGVLDRMASSGQYDLKGFVVRRGNDSSTWNEAAGAFNKARDGWINAMHALGLTESFDAMLPGKALRLMAADVVAWHRRLGEPLDPDTRMARRLPKPWRVVLGRAQCTRADIVAAAKIEAVTGRGWVAPRPTRVARSSATPELVHGVLVSAPALAQVLRRAGVAGGPSKAARLRPEQVPPLRRVETGDVVRFEPV